LIRKTDFLIRKTKTQFLKIIKKLPKSLPAGFFKHSEETGQIPDCSFYLAVSISRDAIVLRINNFVVQPTTAYPICIDIFQSLNPKLEPKACKSLFTETWQKRLARFSFELWKELLKNPRPCISALGQVERFNWTDPLSLLHLFHVDLKTPLILFHLFHVDLEPASTCSTCSTCANLCQLVPFRCTT